jgi:hypothetical protein
MNSMSLCILLLSLLFGSQPASFSEWRGIAPLHSTRPEVEKILGKPKKSDSCLECTYKTDTETIHLSYAKARCAGHLPGWDVPADTVLEFTVIPNDGLAFVASDFAHKNPVYVTAETFVIQEEGLAYWVDKEANKIKSIRHLPKTSDVAQRCRDFPAYNPAGAIYLPQLSFLHPEIGPERLDAAAADLRNGPDELRVYVVVYASKGMFASEYSKLLDSYRSHLYTKRRLSNKKIIVLRGGWREEFSGEIFYLQVDSPPPVPSPEVLSGN